MIAQPYPLQWPPGVDRTKGPRKSSPFGSRKGRLTVAMAVARVEDEVRRMKGAEVATLVVSSNLAGTVRSQPNDPGVAVYFLRNRPYCFPCDRYSKVADNVAAVAKHLEALRGIERWGVGTVEQLFSGFTALPAPGSDWREVLGILGSGVDAEAVEARFRSMAKTMHPDRGGTHEGFVRLEAARRAALAELSKGATT